MAKHPSHIALKAGNIIEDIRELSRSRKEFWQQIPYAALMADGRSGYIDRYSRAYRLGYWVIARCNRSIYVDLETGELVNAEDPGKPAHPADILPLALNLDELDAEHILQDLLAQEPISSYRYDETYIRKRADRILEFIEKGNITPTTFRRLQKPEEVRRAQLLSLFLD